MPPFGQSWRLSAMMLPFSVTGSQPKRSCKRLEQRARCRVRRHTAPGHDLGGRSRTSRARCRCANRSWALSPLRDKRRARPVTQMTGLSGPLTRVDMRRAPFRVKPLARDARGKGGLYGALRASLTSDPYCQSPRAAFTRARAATAAVSARITRGPREMGRTKGFASSAARSSRSNPPSGPIRTASGPGRRALSASMGEACGAASSAKIRRRVLVPGGKQLRQFLGLHHLGHAQNAALLGRLDGVGEEALGLDALGHGVARDHRAERARAELGRFLRHIVEAGALQRREQIMQIGAVLLRARLVLEASLGLFPADGAELGAPLPVLAVEQQEPVARLESEHVSEVMRLVLAQARSRRPVQAWT